MDAFSSGERRGSAVAAADHRAAAPLAEAAQAAITSSRPSRASPAADDGTRASPAADDESWAKCVDPNGEAPYWFNNDLELSSWSDPRTDPNATIFDAAAAEPD